MENLKNLLRIRTLLKIKFYSQATIPVAPVRRTQLSRNVSATFSLAVLDMGIHLSSVLPSITLLHPLAVLACAVLHPSISDLFSSVRAGADSKWRDRDRDQKLTAAFVVLYISSILSFRKSQLTIL